ncbi:MAG: site-specific integrase [Clostridiales bacterium]|nr:site-specific integrase [Clostridiales bacterium]
MLGTPEATPHWCRHTFATRLHVAGADELCVKRLLGHANKDVTEHYTHTDIELLKTTVSKLA